MIPKIISLLIQRARWNLTGRAKTSPPWRKIPLSQSLRPQSNQRATLTEGGCFGLQSRMTSITRTNLPYCILTEGTTAEETTAEEATAEIAATTTIDALTRTGYQNPVAPYARFAITTTPRPNAPCPCAHNAS